MTDNGTPQSTAPDTIVLIHGLWMRPQLGALGRPLRGQGLPRALPPPTRAWKSRSRRCARTRPRSRRLTSRTSSST